MSLLFWFVAWAMTLLVLGLVLWPLLKRQAAADQDDLEKRLSVYRQQFAELEADLKNVVVTEEQYRQSKDELERRLLQETAQVEPRPASPRRQLDRRVVAAILAVMIPTASGLLYWKFGNPLAITYPSTSPSASLPAPPAGVESDHQTTEGLEALSEKLRKKLEQNPGDGVGWALLGRSYAEMGKHTEAVRIYEKAMALIPDDPQLLVDYADALGMLQGRKLEGKPEQMIQRALKLDPNNVKALMLAGTVSYDRKQYTQAVQQWEKAVANFPPDIDNEIRQELMAGIAEAKSLAGGPSSEGRAANVSASSARQPVAITGTVSLAPNLTAKGAPTDTLFVFAREANGPPMPVSIVRATKKDLPFTFRLDDATSPMPSRPLSSVGHVIIVARLSKSGEAMPKSGDLQGMSEPMRPGSGPVTIVIDREIP